MNYLVHARILLIPKLFHVLISNIHSLLAQTIILTGVIVRHLYNQCGQIHFQLWGRMWENKVTSKGCEM